MHSMLGYKDKEIKELEQKIKVSNNHIMDLESNMRN